MKNKLPNVYVNKIDKKIKNNKESFYSKEEIKDEKQEEILIKKMMIRKKINDIFSSPNFVYKVNVLIKLDGKDIKEIVVARTKDHLITLHNKVIEIDTIKDIKLI